MMMTGSVLPLLLLAVLLQTADSFSARQVVHKQIRSGSLGRQQQVLHRPVLESRRRTVLVSSLDEELPKFNDDIVQDDDNDDSDSSSKSSKIKSTTNSNNSNESLLTSLNEFGMSLKPRAQEVDIKAAQASKMKRKIGLKAKASLFWTLYMAYRGYRGFFVILPAVFSEVYRKMETAVDLRVLDDAPSSEGSDVNPETGKVRWRTKITVSALAGIVTLTYVVGGLARVFIKFAKTILRTSSLSGSLSAAAEEVEGNEGRLMRIGGQQQKEEQEPNVNGKKDNNSGGSGSGSGRGRGRNVAF
ncbi:expressed unknown protein [Seminavis robusta]|uniref:Uncharacterized protein n=1 Tax=Seminavis robusta TaxID=568900 RepID=A0A9N8HHN5_9STRA|nr:expressed unknown protein [Seminavis robusta]|eukprot:Sro457_g146950.1 n/a (301) ;mRNA; r:56200-57102